MSYQDYQDYIDRQNQQLMDDLLGRGPGDPDIHGYPGQVEAPPDNYYEDKLIESIEARDENHSD